MFQFNHGFRTCFRALKKISIYTNLYILLLFQPVDHHVNEIDILPARKLDDSFLWHSSEENNGTVKVTTCRNSVQGKALIVDDKGNDVNRLFKDLTPFVYDVEFIIF